ncbi:NUDIX hydrolase [Streptomyces sp. B93]|uniref:NUDIX hydrolase n=1 Tax=Streptomyces sp. B93 TaxID=2824875 RepID=UPI001B367B1F|nr:NUDIX hydrolase [Streptomyces sp. B93]MBQ1092510.1 NUDIX hydrolase [Streptomyces sp. B93]
MREQGADRRGTIPAPAGMVPRRSASTSLQDGETLEEAALAGQAARELAEELGITAAAEDLKLWVVTHGENGSVGLTYLAPPLSETALRARFTAAASADREQGRAPELDEITLVHSPGELAGRAGPHADYLAPIVSRYLGYSGPPGGLATWEPIHDAARPRRV